MGVTVPPSYCEFCGRVFYSYRKAKHGRKGPQGRAKIYCSSKCRFKCRTMRNRLFRFLSKQHEKRKPQKKSQSFRSLVFLLIISK